MRPGTQLGPYEILQPLGKGGMGEVWRARDTRLDRDVAIKVLPAELAGERERLARFEQEARAAAALNHPHIAVVHDVGSEPSAGSTTTHYIVQELLEGETLRARLERGRLPIDEALDLAIEIGEALIAAHDAGIVHRDLKPENVFVTPQGHAKVLDFGLAKLTEAAPVDRGSASMSPTMVGTRAGVAMGTAGYMAPEQVVGEEVDRRADLFAFGAVLYEIVTGSRAFAGESVVQVLSRLTHEEPAPPAELLPTAPAELWRIVRKCLAKKPARRYQGAADLCVDLRQLREDLSSGVARPARDVGRPADAPAGRTPVALGLRQAVPAAFLLLLVGVWLGSSWLGSSPASPPLPEPTHLTLPVASGHEMMYGYYPQIAISPDGRRVAFHADDRLWVRDLSERDARPVVGTERGISPFFSSDGEWLGFGQGRGLRRIRLADESISDLLSERSSGDLGVAWIGETMLVGSNFGGVVRSRVGAAGDTAVTVPDAALGETAHAWPQALEGGSTVLYTALGPSFLARDAKIVVEDLASGDRTVVVEQGTHGRYLPTGHVVFVDGAGTLLAVPFDLPRRRRYDVAPVPVAEPVRIATWAGGASYAVSASGTLVYAVGSNYGMQQLVWVDRSGTISEPVGTPISTDTYTLSPDGRTVAVDDLLPDNLDIVLFDVETGARTRLTNDPAVEENGIFSGRGDRIAYLRAAAGNTGQVMVQSLEPGAEPAILHRGTRYDIPLLWSPDDRYLLVSQAASDDLLAFDVNDADAEPLLVEDAYDWGSGEIGSFSPDGRFLAHPLPDGRGLAVDSFPDLDEQWGIGRGQTPRWSADGGRIYFLRDDRLMSIDVQTEPTFRAGEERALFEIPEDTPWLFGFWPSPDGERFLTAIRNPAATNRAFELHVVLNWTSELLERVPIPD